MRFLISAGLMCLALGAAVAQTTAPPIAAKSQQVAVAEPKYLEIKNFKKCTSTVSKGSWREICLPAKRRAGCPASTYRALKELDGMDKMPDCE